MEQLSRFSNARLDHGVILSQIKKVEADQDWDGISAAVQIKTHFPEVEIHISDNKLVDSDSETLVLDKGTFGEGWVIDHHPVNMKSKNILHFCPSGDASTGRLTYEILPKKSDNDLFISATAEIADGLYEHGLLHGSLKALQEKEPNYFKKSKKINQFMVEKEIYLMADIFCILSTNMPESALRLGLDSYKSRPSNAEELVGLLTPKALKLVGEYMTFMENFPEDLFEHRKIKFYDVNVADARNIGKFSHVALARTRITYPGNYLLFRGDRISVRTNDSLLFDTLVKVMGSHVLSYGGRKEWHGIRLKNKMDYSYFLDLMDKSGN